MLEITMIQKYIIAVLLIIVAAGIILAVYYFDKKQAIFRKLSKFKVRRIGQIQSNELAKISGKTLHVHEPLIAPFSKRKCVLYIIKIQHHKSRGKSSYWKTLVDEEKAQDFFLKQSDEVVMVKLTQAPKNYDCYLMKDRSISSGLFKEATPEFERLLRSYNIEVTNFLGFNKRLRYSERIIEVGEEITVGGIAKWKTLNEPIPEYSYSKIATLESSAIQKLIITDDPSAQPPRRDQRF